MNGRIEGDKWGSRKNRWNRMNTEISCTTVFDWSDIKMVEIIQERETS